jgi:hypothetical protein
MTVISRPVVLHASWSQCFSSLPKLTVLVRRRIFKISLTGLGRL